MKATHTLPTLDQEPDVTPADLLRGAAHYLRRYGHTQGQFFEMLAEGDGPFMSACASGAIMTAATGRCISSFTGDCTHCDEDSEHAKGIRAMRVFAAFLDTEYPTSDTSAIDVIGDWNDDHGRTLSEVVQALTDAADDWDRAHPTGGAR
jgi:hypothetical protein